MHSGCLSHPGALQACPAPRTLPHALEMRTILPVCGPHRNAQKRSAATSSPPPLHAPSVSDSGTPAAGAGGRGPCWWLPGDPDFRWKVEDPEISSHFGLPPLAWCFCAASSSLRGRGWVAPPGRPSSCVQPARTFSFPRSLSLSPFSQDCSLSSRHLTPGEKLLFQVCKSPMQVSAGVSGNKGCVEPSILGALAG